MIKVTFISHDGDESEVSVEVGISLMRAAVDNGVPGIDGDCGGQCACATCHVYIDSPWDALIPPLGSREDEMLSFTSERANSSRLACQVKLTAELAGMVVRLPIGQH